MLASKAGIVVSSSDFFSCSGKYLLNRSTPWTLDRLAHLVDPVETGMQVAPAEGWTANALEQTAALSGPGTAAMVTSIKQWQAAHAGLHALAHSGEAPGHPAALPSTGKGSQPPAASANGDGSEGIQLQSQR